MKPLVASALLALAACATRTAPSAETPSAWKSPEEPAILAAVDKVLLALGNQDAEALKAIMIPEGTAYFQRRTDAAENAVQRRTHAQLLNIQPGADPFIERYWDPVVLVRGSIAMVWAPYELRDNGQVVHCGIDGFDMVKIDGAWRAGNVVSTMEPDACDEIRPPTVGAMRPRNGWKETPLN